MTAELKSESTSNKPFGIWKCVTQAYTLFSNHLTMVVYLALIFGTLDTVFSLLTFNIFLGLEQAGNQGVDVPAHIYLTVISSVVLYVLLYALFVIGVQKVFVTILRGEQANLQTFFSAFNRAGSILLGMFLLYGVIFLASAILVALHIAALSFEMIILSILATVAVLIFGFLIYMRLIAYSFFGLVLLDNKEMNVISALKKSHVKMWDHVVSIIMATMIIALTLLPAAILIGLFLYGYGGGNMIINAFDIVSYYIFEAMALLPMILLAVFYHRVFDQ